MITKRSVISQLNFPSAMIMLIETIAADADVNFGLGRIRKLTARGP